MTCSTGWLGKHCSSTCPAHSTRNDHRIHNLSQKNSRQECSWCVFRTITIFTVNSGMYIRYKKIKACGRRPQPLLAPPHFGDKKLQREQYLYLYWQLSALSNMICVAISRIYCGSPRGCNASVSGGEQNGIHYIWIIAVPVEPCTRYMTEGKPFELNCVTLRRDKATLLKTFFL